MKWDVDRYFEGMKRVYHGSARADEITRRKPFKLKPISKGEFDKVCPFCKTVFKGKKKNNECPFCGRLF